MNFVFGDLGVIWARFVRKILCKKGLTVVPDRAGLDGVREWVSVPRV